MLSQRSKVLPVDTHYFENYSVNLALRNPFDINSNPQGIINFGTAVSGLMDDIWQERFESGQFFIPKTTHCRYYQFWGHDAFRNNIARFMTQFFKPSSPIHFQDLYVLNGALTSLDVLTHLLTDEGECILFAAPGYTGYFQAGRQRWGTKMVPVPLPPNPETGKMFELSVSLIETAIEEEISKGNKVRAFLLNNPHNPSGKVFDADLVREVMKLCQRRGIHLIADEVYCMSVFDKSANFQSTLEIHDPKILDCDKLHVIWGFSKDLCLTGYQTGVIYTRNKELQLALKSGSRFQTVPLPVMDILTNVIENIEWFTEIFVPTNHKKLAQAYEICKAFFDRLGYKTTKTEAGFFFLVDFGTLCNPPNETNSKALIKKFYEHKIYLTPSWEMGADHGWFRFVFTGYSTLALQIGLQRLEMAINESMTGKLQNNLI